MLTELCLATAVFAGYSQSIQTPWHHNTDISGPSAEIQSCLTGFGARLAFGQQWVQAGPQFGYQIPLGQDLALTVQIHGGLGHSNQIGPNNKRQVTLYNGGADLVFSYHNMLVKAGYDHMSRATGLVDTNIGQDQFTVQVGFLF